MQKEPVSLGPKARIENWRKGFREEKSGTSFARNDYGYDYVGRRTFQSLNQGSSDTYNYNAEDEVTNVSYGSGRNVTYALDLVGNRTSVTDNGTATSYTANNLNQYTAVSGNTISYDGRGNLTNWNTVAGYQYDAANRLTLAVVSGHNVQNSYDARNRVVARTIDGVTKYFVWDNWNLIAEYSGGALQKKYINGAKIDEILVKINGGTVYYHQNALGSTIALTDSNGTVIEKYTYDIYGKPSFYDGSGNALTASAYDNRFLFTGREYLAEVNLYDYRNRYYSADLGRWLQRDPIGEKGGLNLYGYCSDSPVDASDPLGLAVINTFSDAMAQWKSGTGGTHTAGASVIASLKASSSWNTYLKGPLSSAIIAEAKKTAKCGQVNTFTLPKQYGPAGSATELTIGRVTVGVTMKRCTWACEPSKSSSGSCCDCVAVCAGDTDFSDTWNFTPNPTDPWINQAWNVTAGVAAGKGTPFDITGGWHFTTDVKFKLP